MRRLIEEAFPLKKVSEDSKHEKSAGRKGHISTLHIWPARRPLAASRAAVIAALLPDPADAPPDVAREYERLAGSPDPVKQRENLCRRIEKVTHWHENGKIDEREMEMLRGLIRKTYGAEPPTVLDIFAGGGAIPLEAMRLGAHAVAVEYNPVAWFILKCTLEFPARLAGKTWPLPEVGTDTHNGELFAGHVQRGDLAAHVRYWGKWVLRNVEREVASYFPIIEGKPPVAYFWARTVPCPDPKCRAAIPLLKTQWLCTKPGKERALRLKPDPATRRVRIEVFTPKDRSEVEKGTVSNAKAFCPFHPQPVIVPSAYIKQCGKEGLMEACLMAVAVAGRGGKEYREPTAQELEAIEAARRNCGALMAELPGGLLHEPISDVAYRPKAGGVADLPRFGIEHYGLVFIPRQQLSLGTIAKWIRLAFKEVLQATGESALAEAVLGYLYCVLARSADRNSSICTWQTGPEKVHNTFTRYALPMTWDFCEVPLSSTASGGFAPAIEWVSSCIDHLCRAAHGSAEVFCASSTTFSTESQVQAIVTDPPYYAAFPYADLSDFFYVWLRRVAGDHYGKALGGEIAPRADELVQHAGYTGGDHAKAKQRYEKGMAIAFRNAAHSLSPDGVAVIVFANKEPDAWDALVTSLIAAGCTVTGSWPIDTERAAKMGATKAAFLSTSVWLVCRRRPDHAGVGRYKEVRRQMEERIAERLRYFWDIGISGPDFMWAAVGPALESYSRYKEVRRLDGEPFTVPQFLREVRRLVTDFALGQILHGASTEGLDEWTRYYLMHRSSFDLEPAPAGECILLAQGYNLDLNELRGPRAILAKGRRAKWDEDEEEGGGGGSDLRLLAWDERKRDDLGLPHPTGGHPYIDALHRTMRLWTAGDSAKVREYLDEHGLKQSDLFWTVAQAILEMSDPKSRERTLLESIVAWGRDKEVHAAAPVQVPLSMGGRTK